MPRRSSRSSPASTPRHADPADREPSFLRFPEDRPAFFGAVIHDHGGTVCGGQVKQRGSGHPLGVGMPHGYREAIHLLKDRPHGFDASSPRVEPQSWRPAGV